MSLPSHPTQGEQGDVVVLAGIASNPRYELEYGYHIPDFITEHTENVKIFADFAEKFPS